MAALRPEKERMDSTKYLIIGGGLAAATAAEQLITADESARGATTILNAENDPPYHRPPLSKGYFLGTEQYADTLIKPAAFYQQNGIDLRYRSRARLIDPAARVCELELNRSIRFDKALIATGASPVHFAGLGRGLEGIYYLRTLPECDRLKAAAAEMNDVVIVGASFIGMELASAFARKKVKTTVIGRATEPWDRLNNPELGRFFRRYFEGRGVRFVLGDEPASLTGTSRVSMVRTKGGRRLSCDGVVFGIGARPNSAIAAESRMEVEDGIVVDQLLQTRFPGIYAAGDVASFPDPRTGERTRIEHWDNAEKQGALAGRNLAGASEPYSAVPMFFSDVFDLSWELWGDPSRPDQVINRDLSEKSASSVYVRGETVSAVFLMGKEPTESQAAEKLISGRINISGKYDILRDPKRSLQDLV